VFYVNEKSVIAPQHELAFEFELAMLESRV